MLSIILFAALQLECEVYRFDDGEIEFWYQVPVTQSLVNSDPAELGECEYALFAKYDYRLSVRSDAGGDSGIIEGIKKVPIVTTGAPEEWQITDYIPLTLYPGHFDVEFLMFTGTDSGYFRTKIEIPEIGDSICSSDLLLGKKADPGSAKYRGNHFRPSVNGYFNPGDTIFSFLELYGLQPDSLYYDARYAIQDSSRRSFYSLCFKRLKAEQVQQETLSLNLGVLVGGQFFLIVTVSDPVSGWEVEHEKQFVIEYDIDLSADKQFYYNIEYLASPKEFKKFKKLTVQEQRLYLKNFWVRHDYARFEERMLKANELFSTARLNGRDSHRGRYLIDHGEPEEREIMPMHEWSRQLELWHYYSLGRDVLFCDIKEDGNSQFIVELDIGELNQILEVGFADEDVVKKWPWLLQIAPGTYREKWRDDIEMDEIQLQPGIEDENP